MAKIDPKLTFKVSELIQGLERFKNKFGDLPVMFATANGSQHSVSPVLPMNYMTKVKRMRGDNTGSPVDICVVRYKEPDSEFHKHLGVTPK